MGRLGDILSFLKVEHSLFALPFVFIGAIIAAGGLPSWQDLLLLVVAAASARTCAMALNRIIDVPLDARNPRTAERHLVTGRISLGTAGWMAALMGLIFAGSSLLLAPLAFMLAPVPLVLFVVYPYAKRLTPWCHLLLGATIGIAPLGGWVGVTGTLADAPIVLFVLVAAWIAGFDIIYSFLDVKHDRASGVHSLVADHGLAVARSWSAGLHGLSIICLFLVYPWVRHWTYLAAALIVMVLLVWQQVTLRPRDTVSVNRAFFTINAWLGWILLAGVLIGSRVV